MTIEQYQKINKLDSGTTTYEYDLGEIFRVDKTQSIDDVRKKINKCLEVSEYKLGKRIIFNKKIWKWNTDFLDQSLEQWERLDQLIADNDNIKNLHMLLSIYFRPCNMFGKMKKYDLNTQENMWTEILKMDVSIGITLMVFFYQNVIQYLSYIRIPSLNEKNRLERSMLTEIP